MAPTGLACLNNTGLIISLESVNSSHNISIREKRFQSARGEELLAIQNLDFELAENRFTCIVGPSGCGKTTTLRIILGLDNQFDGSVAALARGRTAAVFQEPRLIPWRTVRQNVELCVESAKVASSKNRGDGRQEPLDDTLFALYQATDLENLLDFYPSELSLGLARRVSLARAFAVEPQLLVLDEPFVSLDEGTATRLRDLLVSVWEARPTTVLMVTHNLEEAAELADRIVILSERPSNVIGEFGIDVPRAERGADERREIVNRISRIQAG